MVGAIITADELEHSKIDGLIRVSPSNRDYAEILKTHLNNQPEVGSAILVYDSNSDSCDLFTKSLREDLKETMGDLIKFADQSFQGGTVGSNVGAGNFAGIMPSICSVKPDVILYAGRRGDLRGFLDALQNRVCSNIPMTVAAAGIDPTVVLGAQEEKQHDSEFTIDFLARTYAKGWNENTPGTPARYQDFKLAASRAALRHT